LKPVLYDHQAMQNTQALEDMVSYVEVATRHGMNLDDNTNAMIFFMVMYHQSPKRALEVLAAAGEDSSIQRLYNYCLDNGVLGQYKTRYKTALTMILAGDNTGIDFEGNIGTPTEDRPGDGTAGTSLTIASIKLVGPHLHLIDTDGNVTVASATGQPVWQVPQASGTVTDPTPPVITPDPPAEGDPTDLGEKAVKWMKDHIGEFKYSQSGDRLHPLTSGSSDCSGATWNAYKHACGIDIGTNCGTQRTHGKLITTSREKIRAGTGLVAGDLIHYWHPNYRHVEMYLGDGTTRTIGLVPSDDPGPKIHAMTPRLDLDGPIKVAARRYV